MGGADSVHHHTHALTSPLSLWLVDLAAGTSLFEEIAREHGLIASEAAVPITVRDTAHAALRIVLAGYAGLKAARQPFAISPGGKPSLASVSNPPIEFSLAHCDTTAIIAISRDGPVGVDLEAPRSVRIADHRRATLIAAATSLRPETPLPEGPGEARFLQAWTRLEALAKATGEGIGTLLERRRRDEAPIAQTTISNRPVHIHDVTLASASPFYAAVAGTAPILASPTPLESLSLPLDRAWLEQWIVGALPDA